MKEFSEAWGSLAPDWAKLTPHWAPEGGSVDILGVVIVAWVEVVDVGILFVVLEPGGTIGIGCGVTVDVEAKI